MNKKHYAFSLFEYEEIIGRFLAITAKFEGPSCFPVKISFDANNMSSPPVITVQVQNIKNDGTAEPIYWFSVDQNTTVDTLLNALAALRDIADKILRCRKENVSYDELKEPAEPEPDDNPF